MTDALIDALLATGPEGLLVCDAEGCITRHNARAARLLAAADADLTGRPARAVLGGALLAWALKKARTSEEPAAFEMEGPAGALRVRVQPVPGAGFVAALAAAEEWTGAQPAHDRLVRELTEGLRAPLASVRAAIETMTEYPDMEPAVAAQFKEIIRAQTVALSEHLEATLAAYSRRAKRHWPLAPVAGAGLVQAVQQAVEAEVEARVCAELPEVPLRVQADRATLAQVLAWLAGRIENATRCETITCRLTRRRQFAALDLTWEGPTISAQRLRRWEREPIRLGGTVVTATVREVVERHGGDVWAQSDGARATVRLLLPALPAPESAPKAAPEGGS